MTNISDNREAKKLKNPVINENTKILITLPTRERNYPKLLEKRNLEFKKAPKRTIQGVFYHFSMLGKS